MKRSTLVILAVVAVTAAVAAALLIFKDTGTPALVGEISPGPVSGVGGFLACSPPGAWPDGGAGEYSRAYVQITEATEIIDQRRRPLLSRPDVLEVGQQVQVYTTGEVRESSPPQVTATRLVVLRDPRPDSPPPCAP